MKCTWKQLTALILALAMSLSLCVTAWAAELESAEDISLSAQSSEELATEEESQEALAEASAEEESEEAPAEAPAEEESKEAPAEAPVEKETEKEDSKEETAEDTSEEEKLETAPAEEEDTEENAASEEEAFTPAAASDQDKSQEDAEAPAEEETEGSETKGEEQLQTQASGVWEAESNNGFDLANSISVNQEINGSTADGYDNDYYKFHLNADGVIHLDFTHGYVDSSDDYWRAYLYFDNEDELDNYTFRGNNAKTVSTTEIGLPAGTYYLRIAPYYTYGGWSTTPYHFSISYTASNDWEKEYNHSFYYADEVPVNQNIFGTQRNGYDDDYYKFHLNADGVIHLNFTHGYVDSSDNYWSAYLYFDNEDELDNYAFRGNNAKTVSTTEIGLPAGTYYLRIAPYYTYGGWSNTPYHFSISYAASNNWEKEFNHSFYLSNEIQVNQNYSGTQRNSNDDDCYKFQLNKDGVVHLDFTHGYIDTSNKLWQAYFYDSNENEIDSCWFKGSDAKTVSTTDIGLSAGTYYLKIVPYNSISSDEWTTARYTFKVSFSDAASAQPAQHTHHYTSKVTKKPTLLQKGVRTYTCTGCGKKYTKAIPKLKPAAVKKVKAVSQKRTSAGKAHAIKVSWSRVNGANGYQIQVSAKKNFSGKRTITVRGGKKTSATAKVKSKGNYYVRVRTWKRAGKKNCYSAWKKYTVYAK